MVKDEKPKGLTAWMPLDAQLFYGSERSAGAVRLMFETSPPTLWIRTVRAWYRGRVWFAQKILRVYAE